jgi:hypothetical protein
VPGITERTKPAKKEQEVADEIGTKLDKLVDGEVKEKVQEQVDEVDTYSAEKHYWPG